MRPYVISFAVGLALVGSGMLAVDMLAPSPQPTAPANANRPTPAPAVTVREVETSADGLTRLRIRIAFDPTVDPALELEPGTAMAVRQIVDRRMTERHALLEHADSLSPSAVDAALEAIDADATAALRELLGEHAAAVLEGEVQ